MEIFLLRRKEHHQVEVYDVINYCLQRCLTVPSCRGLTDMTSCEHFLCIYVADFIVRCIHRLDSQSQGKTAPTQWPVNDRPEGLSVNRAHNLLVTCPDVHKIKEFNSDGGSLREIVLPDGVINPFHAIQLTSGQFVVCHGVYGDPVQRVCIISADGGQIVHSHGGRKGSNTDECDGPIRVAVDSGEHVYIADRNNRRVKLLSPTLAYVRDVVPSDLLKWLPCRLCLGEQSRHLYIAESGLIQGWQVDSRTCCGV